MAKIMTSSNSGVEGASGYSFQRCCVIFLIFEDFEKLSSESYFICLEHHEDFLFAFLDEKGDLKKVDTYQAKKSRDDWEIDSDFCEIIGKMISVGKELLKDDHPKSSKYNHTLRFLTNRNISLKSKKKAKQKQQIIKVQVSNKSARYADLHQEIKTNIESRISEKIIDQAQLEKIEFHYIDLPQSYQGWQRVLTGLSTEHFGSSINDHEAIISTLMRLLQEIEQTYNDNNVVLLSNKSKRLTQTKIKETFEMFTESKKSFDFWRKYSEKLSEELDIKLPIRRKAKELLENCFDYFKDIQQIEYRKIYQFVKNRTDIDERHNSEANCIIDLYHCYRNEYSPRLENHMIAFAVIAAYVETRGMYA